MHKKQKEFVSKYGTLLISPVDMDHIREVRLPEWSRDNPDPVPPKIAPRYYRENASEMLAIKKEKGISRKEAIELWQGSQEPVDNFDDPDYKREKMIHDRDKFVFLASFVIMAGVMSGDNTLGYCVANRIPVERYVWATLMKIKADWVVYQELYAFIQDTSELTERLVIKYVEQLGYLWQGRPLLDIVRSGILPKGNTSSTWEALGYVAAKEIEKIGPYKFMQLNVDEQAWIMAVYLTGNWIQSLEREDQKKKSEKERERNKR